MTTDTLKAPFPYFGGKSKVAAEVWTRFGSVDNYVEPFFGSGAVLLGCPHPGHTETVNDADGLLSNFWRALQADPEAVARYADYPVSELDLHSRHRWLVNARPRITELMDDPDAYDAKAAGWWVWGISQWIGSGWCPEGKEPSQQVPYLQAGMSPGSDGSMGVHRKSLSQQLPKIGANGAGVDSMSSGVMRKEYRASGDALAAYLHRLSERLRRTRVTCGDFARVLGPSVTWRHGTTAVFLDPPYDQTLRADVYAVESDAAYRARAWAWENGGNPLLRIAYCGYDDGAQWPDGWAVYRWKTAGGYGSQGNGRGRENADRECVWFSPHCINETPLERLLKEAA